MQIWNALRIGGKPNMTAGGLTPSELKKIHAQYNQSQESKHWKNESDYSSKKFFVASGFVRSPWIERPTSP